MISPIGVYGRASGLPSSTSGVGSVARSSFRPDSFIAATVPAVRTELQLPAKIQSS